MKWVQIWSLRRHGGGKPVLDIVSREMMMGTNSLISHLNGLMKDFLPPWKTSGSQAENEKQTQSALETPLISLGNNATGDSGTLRARRSLPDLRDQSLCVSDPEPGVRGKRASPSLQKCKRSWISSSSSFLLSGHEPNLAHGPLKKAMTATCGLAHIPSTPNPRGLFPSY